MKRPNHLEGQTSPYLLQHLYNPVDWHPWGDDAFRRAKEEDRLLLISIGYSACHWCHVMEHESFEDPEVAEVMNLHFLPVKVDREERPDIDHVYMNACFLITGRGGWPLNVIALPDGKPVYAGTYFPKQNWLEVLRFFADAFKNNRSEMMNQSDAVLRELKKISHAPGFQAEIPEDTSFMEEVIEKFSDHLDLVEGGSKGAPKFPMPANLSFLMRAMAMTPVRHLKDYLRMTLLKMSCGGIYDQLGGGFARYSTDSVWRVPHFEKMLYDNAQLISLYSRGWQRDHEPRYRRVAEETLEFVKRELTSPEGVFWSSIDADSEGIEGTYYCWTTRQIREAAGEEADEVIAEFNVTDKGNWEEGKNVLYLDPERKRVQDQPALQKGIRKLFKEREKRIRPATDDKVITAWNALMITALTDAYQVFGSEAYLQQALVTGRLYADATEQFTGRLYRNYKNKRFTIPGFLDDYGFMISAFLGLYETTFDIRWLKVSEKLANHVLTHFNDPDSGLFRYVSDEEEPLINPTVETQDNVIPSSNSEMARALYRLGRLTGNQAYTAKSRIMLGKMIAMVRQDPGFHANWAHLLADVIAVPPEIAVVGEKWEPLVRELQSSGIPGAVFSGGTSDAWPEPLAGKAKKGKTLVYVCRGKVCQSPVDNAAAALDLVRAIAG